MSLHAEKVIQHYTEAYHNLYKRTPRDLRILDQEWIIVNGARMRLAELEYLTEQLQQEYQQSQDNKRGLVMRLVKWFKG
jgi:hypothetical protein